VVIYRTGSSECEDWLALLPDSLCYICVRQLSAEERGSLLNGALRVV